MKRTVKKWTWAGLFAVGALLGTAFALFGLAAPACNDPNPDALTGATQPTGNGSIYPHSDNFAKAEQHGKYVIEYGPAECQGCHGVDYRGGSSGVSCYRCHALHPHADGYDAASKHGRYGLEHGTGGCAVRCHGADLKGGDSGISCFQCHASYPHAAGWADIAKHGVYTDGQGGPQTCANACHGANYQGGDSGVSCFSCHAPYPHRWTSDEGHGGYAAAHGLSTCQTQCHGTDLSGGVSGVSCFQCHEDFGGDDDK